MTELFVPAQISRVTTLDPGEIRLIELTLPRTTVINHVTYPIQDTMRPGTAFLIKPWGARTGKQRRRMYTRSNCSADGELLLQTIINHTHLEKADTSIWWQTDEVLVRQQNGEPIGVRVEWDKTQKVVRIYENTQVCDHTNLRLEPDGDWEQMRWLVIAFSTGITPFLSYLRYMVARDFGIKNGKSGAHVTLIASVRHQGQLMEHETLLEWERLYPQHFQYHPVLTRSWPEDWPYTKGRVIRVQESSASHPSVDMSSLLDIVPDLNACHVRMCGNKTARDHLWQGFYQAGLRPLSFRSEVW